jgi:hypothetical protein
VLRLPKPADEARLSYIQNVKIVGPANKKGQGLVTPGLRESRIRVRCQMRSGYTNSVAASRSACPAAGVDSPQKFAELTAIVSSIAAAAQGRDRCRFFAIAVADIVVDVMTGEEVHETERILDTTCLSDRLAVQPRMLFKPRVRVQPSRQDSGQKNSWMDQGWQREPPTRQPVLDEPRAMPASQGLGLRLRPADNCTGRLARSDHPFPDTRERSLVPDNRAAPAATAVRAWPR